MKKNNLYYKINYLSQFFLCTLYCPNTLTKVVFHISQLSVLVYNCPLTFWEYRLQFIPPRVYEIKGETWKKKKVKKGKKKEPTVYNVGNLSPLSFKDVIW